MSEELPPTPPELERLLRAEAARPGPSDEVAERLLSRVLLAGGGSPDGDPDGGAPPPSPGAPPGSGAAAAEGAIRGANTLAMLTGTAGIVGGFVLGVVTTLAVGTPEAPAPPAPVAAIAPVEVEEPDAGDPDVPAALADGAPTESDGGAPEVAVTRVVRVEPTATTPEPEAADRATSEPATDPAAADPPAATTSLAEESLLIARAQSALARGRSAAALEALAEHEARFPDGQFAEEREALAVRALVAGGDLEAARARAAAFEAAYPRSPLLRVVRAALEPAP